MYIKNFCHMDHYLLIANTGLTWKGNVKPVQVLHVRILSFHKFRFTWRQKIELLSTNKSGENETYVQMKPGFLLFQPVRQAGYL